MQRALFHLLGVGVGPLHRCSSSFLLLQIPRLSRARGCRSPFPHRQLRLRLSDSKVHMSANPNSDAYASSAVATPHLAYKPKVRYCQSCGGETSQVIPNGEEKLRAVCTICGKIHYENPKMVVGCLVEQDGKVLLCRRNIEPSYGLWTLPAGYLEIGESASEGAIRETLEEACADVEVVSPFAHLDIPRIGQSYVIFRARLKKPKFSPGPESLECALFSLDEIPFDSLAFSSISVTLRLYIEDVRSGNMKFHYCTINKRLGASPSDPSGFSLECHLQS